MVIIDIKTLCDGIVEGFFRVSHAKQGDYRDSNGNSRFGGEDSVFMANGVNNFIEVAVGIVGLLRNHFEHPGTILKHQRKVQIMILMRDILFAELNLAIFSNFEEVAFDFFSPFDVGDAARFFPVGVECKSM